MLDWFKKRKPNRPATPDFSAVDSLAKAVEMFQRGELEKLYLMPLEYGGTDNPLNTLYVPVGVAAVKSRIDNGVIAELVAAGTVSQYSAKPAYQGKSFIPISVTVVASNPGEFTTTINIWGSAVTGESAT